MARKVTFYWRKITEETGRTRTAARFMIAWIRRIFQRTYQLRTDSAFAVSMVTLTGEVWRLFHCRTLRTAVHIASFYLASAGRMGTLFGCCDILAHGHIPFRRYPAISPQLYHCSFATV